MSEQAKVPDSVNTRRPAGSSPPPKGPSIWIVLLLCAVAIGMLVAGVHWSSQLTNLWAKISPPPQQQAEASQPDQKQWYTCGMHPRVVLPTPGDCPICHMKLVPLDPSKLTNELTISPEISQSIGVRVAPAVSGPVTKVIRTVGIVDYDETLVRDVNLKIGGWVEKLSVDYIGQAVEKDQPLLEIYSPELYTAQQEYINAFKASGGSGTQAAAGSDAQKWGGDLVTSARKRLENFDISPQQIKQLEQTGQANKTMTLRSPYQGLVIAKNVVEGSRVEPGTQLYRIADLSKVWIMVTLYEYQIPFVQVGQKAVVGLPYIPNQTFEGKVGYIYPYITGESRQVKVRVELDNPNLLLKPGMYTDVELRSTLASNRVLVPREAIVDTGSRKVAFVSLGEGRFEPRDVKLGEEAEDGMISVDDGIKAGEMIVTSGNFLLDSESRLREDIAKMVRGELAVEQEAQATIAGTAEVQSLPQPISEEIIKLMNNYFAIGDKLADDTTDGIAEPARAAAAGIDALLKMEMPGDPHFWHKHTEAADIRGKALEIIDAKDIAAARETFADLGTALEKLLMATGVPPAYGKEVQALHCPMYRQGQGGTWWLQVAGPVRNPYYGKSMLECKDKQLTLPATGASR